MTSGTCTLAISMRSLDREIRELIGKRLKAIVNALAESFGVKTHADYRKGYAVLVNKLEETEFARRIGRKLVGDDHVEEQGPAVTASKDLAFMPEICTGGSLRIGNGAPGEHGSCLVHNPGYDFNDGNLPIGAAHWALLAESYLQLD